MPKLPPKISSVFNHKGINRRKRRPISLLWDNCQCQGSVYSKPKLALSERASRITLLPLRLFLLGELLRLDRGDCFLTTEEVLK